MLCSSQALWLRHPGNLACKQKGHFLVWISCLGLCRNLKADWAHKSSRHYWCGHSGWRPWENCSEIERREAHSLSGCRVGFRLRLPILVRRGCTRGGECGAPSSVGDLGGGFPVPLEGHGAAQSWEEPETSPKTSTMGVSPEAKGNGPTCFLEGSFELRYFPDFPKHIA